MAYATNDVAKLLKLPAAQVRALARAGIIEPHRGPRGEYLFSFQDIVLLRTASSLRRAHVPPVRMQRAFTCLKNQLGVELPLSAVQVDAVGEHIVVHDGDVAWDVETDQLELDFSDARGEMRALPYQPLSEIAEAETWFQHGLEVEAATPEDAAISYQQAIKLNPNHEDARINLGRLLHSWGRTAEAIEQYRAVMGIRPNFTAAFNLAVALEDLGYCADAMQAYRDTLIINPNMPDAHYNLGKLYESIGDSVSAIRHLKAYRALVKA